MPFHRWGERLQAFKNVKKTVTWKYSSASDIDSVYALRVSDNGGMLICRFAWWGRPYGRVKKGEKFT